MWAWNQEEGAMGLGISEVVNIGFTEDIWDVPTNEGEINRWYGIAYKVLDIRLNFQIYPHLEKNVRIADAEYKARMYRS